MQGQMKTAVMTAIGKVEIQERPIPVPKENEALIKVEYVGICGSDLHYYESGRIGDFIVGFSRNMWRTKQDCALNCRSM